jgi:hypothetical protein
VNVINKASLMAKVLCIMVKNHSLKALLKKVYLLKDCFSIKMVTPTKAKLNITNPKARECGKTKQEFIKGSSIMVNLFMG